MAIFTVFRVEWQRIWRNKLTRAAMVVGLILPLLYSFLYLWAFWDPYGTLDKLPVAIVNQDAGGTLHGKPVNYGESITSQLLKDNDLGWHVVANGTAMSRVQDGTYYAVLKIPKDFTRDILSVSGDKPTKAQIQFIPNQGTNYLAGNIIDKVQTDLAASLNQQFSQKFIQQLLGAVTQAGNGLDTAGASAKKLVAGSQSANSGAVKLDSGIASASSGAEQLASALTQLAPGSSSVTSGLSQTAAGTKSAAQGVAKATSALAAINQQLSPAAQSAGSLYSGLNEAAADGSTLTTAATHLANGVNSAESGANALASGTSSATSAANEVSSGLEDAMQVLNQSPTNQDPNVQQALAILESLYPGMTSLSDNLGTLNSGAQTLSESLGQVQSGQQQLDSGLSQLASSLAAATQGANSLSNGLGEATNGLASVQTGLQQAGGSLNKLALAQSQLAAGSKTVSSGLSQAKSGATALNQGLGSVKAGWGSLETGLQSLSRGMATFSSQLNGHHVALPTNSKSEASLMSQPISMTSHPLDAVGKYGPGLTPYFLPLSLWVGALMLYFMISLREGRWRLSPVSGVSVTLGKFAVLWCIGVGQAVIAASALLFGLGLNVTSAVDFYLYAIVLALSYITIIGTLISVFGAGPGRFIAIVLLLLQLTSSGGTFPVQLVPQFFQTIHSWLPMSYAVTGLRRLIAFHDLSAAWSTLVVTAGYMGASLVVTLVFNMRKLTSNALKSPDGLVA